MTNNFVKSSGSVFRRLCAIASLLSFLTACGGGSSQDNSESPQSGPALAGTASIATPLSAASLTVKDANGQTKTGTTRSDGGFSVSAEGLSYPVMVRVEVPSADNTQVSVLYAALSSHPDGPILVSPLSSAQASALSHNETELLFNVLGTAQSARNALAAGRFAETEAALQKQVINLIGAGNLSTLLNGTTTLTRATIQGGVQAISKLLTQTASLVGQAELARAVGGSVGSVSLACDVQSLRLGGNGSVRPTCLTGSDTSLSSSFMGDIRPVAVSHPASADAWADELAGVNLGRNWKHFTPQVDATQLQQALERKLKSEISTLWSGGGIASFPETQGIADGSIQELVDSVIGIQWAKLGAVLKAPEVSNLTFEYQVLRTLLGSTAGRKQIFPFMQIDAVRLAVPSTLDRERTLNAFGPAIEAFAKQWLLAPDNRAATASAPSGVREVQAAFEALYNYLTSNSPLQASEIEIVRLGDAWIKAANQLPDALATLRAAAIAYAQASVQFGIQCATAAVVKASDNSACLASGAAAQRTGLAYQLALSSVTQSAPPTAAQFYTRFLTALGTFISNTWDQHHDSIYPVQGLIDTPPVTYSPVVARVQAYDGLWTPECCLTSKELSSRRSGMLYVVDGASVRFKEDVTGRLLVDTEPDAPLLRLDIDTFSAAGPRGQALSPTTFDALLRPGSVVDAYLIGCAQADEACMARFQLSRIEPGTTAYSTATFDTTLMNQIRRSGGMGDGMTTLHVLSTTQ
ncbi:hypothetical protein HZU83_16685 [Sphaerotilus montanus]|uniref:Carboxypeptidase regulatory-like domain-containing protein n=1 Tax=Sphaerotilus montanus TaxID=522889 RepID=A0A7Y9QXX9_9BURK|nr:hypothetical protein [Sphaerotilus montanus]NYG33502.1 hypothetical protein [Sphaerotilus montanus]NZD58329.1 hypothetical protein [Sphaerotilus montanus]